MSTSTFTPEFARRLLDQIDAGAFDSYLTPAARTRLRDDALRSLGDAQAKTAAQLRLAASAGVEL